jgi:hypothetical protein
VFTATPGARAVVVLVVVAPVPSSSKSTSTSCCCCCCNKLNKEPIDLLLILLMLLILLLLQAVVVVVVVVTGVLVLVVMRAICRCVWKRTAIAVSYAVMALATDGAITYPFDSRVGTFDSISYVPVSWVLVYLRPVGVL